MATKWVYFEADSKNLEGQTRNGKKRRRLHSVRTCISRPLDSVQNASIKRSRDYLSSTRICMTKEGKCLPVKLNLGQFQRDPSEKEESVLIFTKTKNFFLDEALLSRLNGVKREKGGERKRKELILRNKLSSDVSENGLA